MKKRIISLLLVLSMVLGVIPLTGIAALAEDEHVHAEKSNGRCECGAILYYDWNDTSKALEERWLAPDPANPVKMLDLRHSAALTEGWYFTSIEKFNSNARFDVSGDVRIILCGATEYALEEINVAEGASLTIYAQSLEPNKMGLLDFSTTTGNAAIGGYAEAGGGDITINGGRIIVESTDGAAIGTGWKGTCGSITINGGSVVCSAKKSQAKGNAAIGSTEEGVCGDITINGGKIVAKAPITGAAIGAGGNESVCGDITINGGDITTTDEYSGSAIGSGRWATVDGDITINGGLISALGGREGPAIGSGYAGSCGYIIINGGIVDAYGYLEGYEDDGTPGIGTGCYGATCKGVIINGGYIHAFGSATSGPIGAGAISQAVEVTYNVDYRIEGTNEVMIGYTRTPRCQPVSCVENGYRDAYRIPSDGVTPDMYYTEFPFRPEALIGDTAAYKAWRTTGEGVLTVPHQFGPGDGKNHKCTVCQTLEPHADADGDGRCDVCGSLKYLAWDETEKAVVYVFEPHTYDSIDASDEQITTGWYMVEGELNTQTVSISGDVHVVLADGCDWTGAGLAVSEGSSLTVYARSSGDAQGKMTMTGDDYCAAIGGQDGENGGSITINGGEITAEGGWGAPGIGGGSNAGNGGVITVNGGLVTAQGGHSAAGIGTGACYDDPENYEGSIITVNGGTVYAYGGGDGYEYGGAGIGTGYCEADYEYSEYVYGYVFNTQGTAGTITINGGSVTANGGYDSSGIGGGAGADGGTIDIHGGVVHAQGGENADGLGDGWFVCWDEDGYEYTTTCVAGGTVTVYKGEVYANGTLIPEKHFHTIVTLAQREATCTEDGISETHYYCPECGKHFYDEAGTSVMSAVNAAARVIPAPGHDFTVGTVDNGDGTHTQTCQRCSESFTNAHTWAYTDSQSHTCTVCKLEEAHTEADNDGLCDGCGELTHYYAFNEENGAYEAKLIPAGTVTIEPSENGGNPLFYGTGKATDGELFEEWYLVNDPVTIPRRTDVNDVYDSGDKVIHLILGNNAELTVTGGLRVCTPFVIYATTTDESKMGRLIANASKQTGCAGIGGGLDEGTLGFNSYPNDTITIHGGKITATGGSGGAGIGGGLYGSDTDKQKAGDVTVYGGEINARGGEFAPAIGSGFKAEDCGMDVTIFGGTFTLYGGGSGGAGIGTGGSADLSNLFKSGGGYYEPASSMGDITIKGGAFQVLSSPGAAGIGSGARGGCGNITVTGGVLWSVIGNYSEDSGYGAAGIGSGFMAYCGDLTFTGGYFYNISSAKNGAGIGAGTGNFGNTKSCGTITFEGGIFNRVIGGYNAPAIGVGTVAISGSTYYRPWCTGIVFNGGFIQALGGGYWYNSAKETVYPAIGAGGGSVTVHEPTVTYAEGMITRYLDFTYSRNTRQVLHVGQVREATCTEDGHLPLFGSLDVHYENLGIITPIIDGEKYFSNISSLDSEVAIQGDVIGDETALAAWLETPVSEGGGLIPALGHADTDGDNLCDRCGKVMDESLPAYVGASLVLSDEISVNFYMSLPSGAVENGIMTFTVGKRKETAEVRINESNGKYYFNVPLNVLEMGTEILASFDYDGVQYEKTYSVPTYIDHILSGTDAQGKAYTAEMQTLAKKIANYGYYTQLYLAFQHPDKVTIGTAEGEYAPMPFYEDADVELEEARNNVTNGISVTNGTNVTLYGRTVFFDHALALNYYVNAADGLAPTAACEDKTVTVTPYGGNLFLVTVRGIMATEFGKQFTVTVGDLTLTGSVGDYCGAVLSAHPEDDAAAAAMASLYEYASAAKAYVDTLKK